MQEPLAFESSGKSPEPRHASEPVRRLNLISAKRQCRDTRYQESRTSFPADGCAQQCLQLRLLDKYYTCCKSLPAQPTHLSKSPLPEKHGSYQAMPRRQCLISPTSAYHQTYLAAEHRHRNLPECLRVQRLSDPIRRVVEECVELYR